MDTLLCILPVQTGIDFFFEILKNRLWCTIRVKQSGDKVMYRNILLVKQW